jgi:hypothetical protein
MMSSHQEAGRTVTVDKLKRYAVRCRNDGCNRVMVFYHLTELQQTPDDPISPPGIDRLFCPDCGNWFNFTPKDLTET